MDKKIIILIREKKVKVRDLFITFNEKVKFNTETLYDIYRSEKKNELNKRHHCYS